MMRSCPIGFQGFQWKRAAPSSIFLPLPGARGTCDGEVVREHGVLCLSGGLLVLLVCWYQYCCAMALLCAMLFWLPRRGPPCFCDRRCVLGSSWACLDDFLCSLALMGQPLRPSISCPAPALRPARRFFKSRRHGALQGILLRVRLLHDGFSSCENPSESS